MEVQLVSPEEVLYVGEADMVVARTLSGGEIAFLNHHATFLGALDVWPVRLILADGTQERFAVHGGFIEVGNNRVIVLSDVAELADGIDVERAQQSLAAAEEAMRINPDDADAVAAFQRAKTRLDAAGLPV